jgi:hypothetical protein
MDLTAAPSHVSPTRVLVVADWRADPYGVLAACRRRAKEGPVTLGLVVPAWLHGLDWLGDPRSSRPCAARQLEDLVALAAAAALDVELAEVGDPDPTSAVEDARQAFGASEILVCGIRRGRGHPLTLARRLQRMTGLSVERVSAGARTAGGERRRSRALLDGGHCAAEPVQAR